jgi:hypothetical protein
VTIRDETDKNTDELPIFSDRCRDRSSDTPRSKPITIEATATHINEPPATTTEEVGGASPGTTLNKPNEDPKSTEFTPPPEAEETPTHSPLPTTIYGPIRSIHYTHIKDRRSLMEQLNNTIPLNHYGLPEFLYRPDLLNPADFQVYPSVDQALQLQEQLKAAIIPIAYHQGFPTFAEGLPIWTAMTFETDEAQRAFAEYLELPGVRSLHSMISWPMDDLVEWLIVNSWVPRAKSFDLYRMTYAQRKRQQRILSTEESHYDIAGNMLKVALKRLGNLTEADYEDMSVTDVANVVEKMVRVQRVSLGLPALGAADPKHEREVRRLKPVEEEMKQIADAGSAELNRQDAEEVDLLRDGSPEAIAAAQDLILKMQDMQRPPPRR